MILLKVFHVVVDLGGVELLAFEVIPQDLIVLFYLVEFGDKFENLIFGKTVFLNKRGNTLPQIIKQIILVITFLPNNLIITIQQVVLINFFLKSKPYHVKFLFHRINLSFPVSCFICFIFDRGLFHMELVFELLDAEGELFVLLLGFHFGEVLCFALLF
jgi:hypothetical protein